MPMSQCILLAFSAAWQNHRILHASAERQACRDSRVSLGSSSLEPSAPASCPGTDGVCRPLDMARAFPMKIR
jgi:hypothetical protein